MLFPTGLERSSRCVPLRLKSGRSRAITKPSALMRITAGPAQSSTFCTRPLSLIRHMCFFFTNLTKNMLKSIGNSGHAPLKTRPSLFCNFHQQGETRAHSTFSLHTSRSQKKHYMYIHFFPSQLVSIQLGGTLSC